MKYEECVSPKSQEELLASIPKLRIREGSVGGEMRFTALRCSRYKVNGVLDFQIWGTLSPCCSGTRICFRVGPGPLSLLFLLLLSGIDLYSVVRLLIEGTTRVSPLFLMVGSLALLVLLLFYYFMRKEVREDFLSRIQAHFAPNSPF